MVGQILTMKSYHSIYILARWLGNQFLDILLGFFLYWYSIALKVLSFILWSVYSTHSFRVNIRQELCSQAYILRAFIFCNSKFLKFFPSDLWYFNRYLIFLWVIVLNIAKILLPMSFSVIEASRDGLGGHCFGKL